MTKYGYVKWELVRDLDRDAGRWKFRLDDTVTSLQEAWNQAVDDFAADRRVFTDAKMDQKRFSYEDLVRDFPEILARHGLTFLPDPDGPETEAVDYDDLLVFGDDDRCPRRRDDDLLCGELLNNEYLCSLHGQIPQDEIHGC